MYAAIPETAERFLHRHIRSLGQLEVFLLLARNPHQWWTPDAISDELRASAVSARDALRQLVSGYLVEFKGVGRNALFGFCSTDPSIAGLVPLLAQLFHHRLSALAECIHGPDHVLDGSSNPTYRREAGATAG